MSVFLEVLNWAVIACGTVGAALALVRLTGRQGNHERAERSAWTALCYSGFLILSAASQLMRGTAAWLALIVACCLLCIALSWEVRSLLRPRSGPASDGAMAEPS
jgi:hypothetical protein